MSSVRNDEISVGKMFVKSRQKLATLTSKKRIAEKMVKKLAAQVRVEKRVNARLRFRGAIRKVIKKKPVKAKKKIKFISKKTGLPIPKKKKARPKIKLTTFY